MSWSKLAAAAMVVCTFACNTRDSSQAAGKQKAVVGYGQGGQGAVGDAFGTGAAPEVAVARASAPRALQAEVAASAGPDALPSSAAVAAETAMIIRTGTATIKVDSLELAIVRLRALAASVGGYVGNTSMQTGSDQLRSATVEIKVPAPRWSQLLSGLKPIGAVEAQDENAEDVGEEFVDVQARVANSRRLEERLIALLADRTGKLSDILAVERELARVREEIDRYEGRIRYLKSRTAISTMTVTLHEPAPVLGTQPGENPIADAFRSAWRLFVGMIAGLIASLGILVPLVALGWVLWRFVLRRRGMRDEGR